MNTTEFTGLNGFLAEGERLENRKLYNVPLDALIPDPDQPRKHFDDASMAELQTSIERHGVLQPIIFRQDAEGQLIIVSGERRFRASKLAQRENIPAIYNDGNATEIALVENLIRENLNPIEEAEALQKLKDEQSYTNEQISAVIGKAVSTISEILSLNRLPETVKAKCRNNPKVSRRALVEIVKTRNDEEMESLFRNYQKKELKSDEMRSATRGKAPLSAVWRKKISDFCTQLDGLDFGEFGDERRGVERVLRGLEQTIQEKLS